MCSWVFVIAADVIDGVNQWPSLSMGSASARSEFIYNLDDSLLPEEGHAAIRLVVGVNIDPIL